MVFHPQKNGAILLQAWLTSILTIIVVDSSHCKMINWSVKIQDDLIIDKLRPPCLVTLPPKNHSLKLTQKNLSFGDFHAHVQTPWWTSGVTDFFRDVRHGDTSKCWSNTDKFPFFALNSDWWTIIICLEFTVYTVYNYVTKRSWLSNFLIYHYTYQFQVPKLKKNLGTFVKVSSLRFCSPFFCMVDQISDLMYDLGGHCRLGESHSGGPKWMSISEEGSVNR